jgi:hypothetical protein
MITAATTQPSATRANVTALNRLRNSVSAIAVPPQHTAAARKASRLSAVRPYQNTNMNKNAGRTQIMANPISLYYDFR